MDPTMDPSQSKKKRKLSGESSSNIRVEMTPTNDGSEADSAATVTPRRDPSSRKIGGKRKRKPKILEEDLGSDYTPSEQDCICGRGKDAQNHPGNVQFRAKIDSLLDEYRQTTTKKEKTTIVCKIIESVRSKGRFVRLHRSGNWYETGDDFAREKIGQCFRDRLHTEYRSSSKAKISRRKDTTTTQPQQSATNTSKPMDFDEYMASREPDNAQSMMAMRRPSISGSNNGHYAQRMQQQQQHQAMFHGPPRKRSNFQGLADMYFGDASNTPSSSVPASNRQQHLDLLGSLSQVSRDNLNTLKSTFNPRMEHPMRMHDNSGGNMAFPQSNMNSFASMPSNMYTKDRRLSGLGFFGGNGSDGRFESQQQSFGGMQQPTDQQKMNMPMGKSYGFMQEALWQTRGQRKPPPMPAGMFNPDPLDVTGPTRPGEVMSAPTVKETVVAAEAPPTEALDSSDQSSRIPDDEPLPLVD